MASNEEELADYEEETEVQEGKGEESKDVKKWVIRYFGYREW